MPMPINQTELNQFITALEQTDDVTTPDFFEAHKTVALAFLENGLEQNATPKGMANYITELTKLNAYITKILKSIDDESTQKKLEAAQPKLEAFLNTNKSFFLNTLNQTIYKENLAIPLLKKNFRLQYRAVLLDYYLNSNPQIWTNTHTQEVLELYKKQLINNPEFKDNLDHILTVFSWRGLQQDMLELLTSDIERLNTKKQALKEMLEANNNSAEATSDAITKWNKFIKRLTEEFTMASYVINSDTTEKFIKNLTSTILHQKSASLSDDNANIINRLYKKSEIEILKAILIAKKNDPQNLYHTQNTRKLFKHLVVYFHRNTNHREGFELPRIIQYFSDIYLDYIKNLFELSPKALEAKIQKILQTRANTQSAVTIMNQSFIEILTSQKTDRYCSDILRAIRLELSFSHEKHMTANHIIDKILDQFIFNIIPNNIKLIDTKIYETFITLTNGPEKSEIISELRSVLYKECRPLILHILEIVIEEQSRESLAHRDTSLELVDDVLLLAPTATYKDENGTTHYRDEPPIPEQLETEEDPLLKTLREQEEQLLTMRQAFIEQIKNSIGATIPGMLYQEYRAKSIEDFNTLNGSFVALLNDTDTKSKFKRLLFPEISDPSQYPRDANIILENFLATTINCASLLHDQDVKAAREAQASTGTPETVSPKKQRP